MIKITDKSVQTKLGVTDFWNTFNFDKSIFSRILKLADIKYKITSFDEHPDVLFFSVFGKKHKTFNNCRKVFFSGENYGIPNKSEYDFAITSYHVNSDNHYRLPLYVLYSNPEHIKAKFTRPKTKLEITDGNVTEILSKHKRFCNFIYSNCNEKNTDGRVYDGVVFRRMLFDALNKYKKVDSGGSCFNNMNGKIKDKNMLLMESKFTIAVENTSNYGSYYGYTTEKILQPFLFGSIPIYFGNSMIGMDFNLKSFINCHEFSDITDVVNKVMEIDRDEVSYHKMLMEPVVLNYDKSPWNLMNAVPFFLKIFNI